MNNASKMALGCGGVVALMLLSGLLGVYLQTRHRTADPEEIRAITARICALTPPAEMSPIFGVDERREEGPAAVWAVDSQFESLMLVVRHMDAMPESAEFLLEELVRVHFALAGFDPEPGAQRQPLRVLGQEYSAVVQIARTLDESKQTRTCVAFAWGDRWVALLLQGSAPDAGPEALQKILDSVPEWDPGAAVGGVSSR